MAPPPNDVMSTRAAARQWTDGRSIGLRNGPNATIGIPPVSRRRHDRPSVLSTVLGPQRWQRSFKRAIDIVGALVGLVVCAIPCVVIALGIKLTSPGPVFFCHTRIGRRGIPFQMIKFRTMRDGTHAEVLASRASREHYMDDDFKLPADDPRITPFGRLLRKLSIDEIPQFLNVLRGDMSLVGIRPLVPAELDLRPRFDRQCYELLRPGLTGAWQVDGRSTITSRKRRELDRSYVTNWSLRRDFLIMLRTPLAVLRIHCTH